MRKRRPRGFWTTQLKGQLELHLASAFMTVTVNSTESQLEEDLGSTSSFKLYISAPRWFRPLHTFAIRASKSTGNLGVYY